MKNTAENILSILAVFLLIASFQSCRSTDHSTAAAEDVGTATFSIQWPEDMAMSQEDQTARSKAVTVNCGLVATITAIIYDSSGETILAWGAWPCSARTGTIYDIPAGSGMRIVVTASNSAGLIVDRGELSGITIIGGRNNALGNIPVDSAVPTRLMGWYANAGTIYQPASNDVGSTVGLWGCPVPGATGYNLYSSTDGSTYTMIDIQNSNYQNSFLFMVDISANTYFRVTAVIPEGESDLCPPVYMEYTSRNSMPSIPMVLPSSTSGATGISRMPTISWTTPTVSTTIAGYNIQLRQVNSFPNISLKHVPSTTTTWHWGDTVDYTYVDPFPASLDAGTTYSIGIAAVDSTGSVIATGGIWFTTGQ